MTILEQVNMLINTTAYCVIAGTSAWIAFGNLKKSDASRRVDKKNHVTTNIASKYASGEASA